MPLAADIPYTVARSRRKTMTLQVSPNAEVTVRAPRWAPLFAVDRFVHKHLPWIQRTVERVQEQKRKCPPPQFISGDVLMIWGTPHLLNLENSSGREVQWWLSDGALRIAMPQETLTTTKVRRVLREAYRQALQERLHTTLPTLSSQMQVAPKTFSIGFARYRWGSCAVSGRLRFNGRLAMMPPQILEYVIVHELAHLRELNHSKRFWNLVAAVLPDFKERRRWLREHGTGYQI
jgi:predicted metal-dependent hydrolase